MKKILIIFLFTAVTGIVHAQKAPSKNKTTTTKKVATNSSNIQLANETAQKAIDLYKKADYSSSLIETEKALKLDPQNFLALLNRGFLYKHNNENLKARNTFTQAISVDSKDFRPYYWRALTYINDNNYPEAIKNLNKAIEFNEGCFSCFLTRGESYEMQEKWDEASADSSSALALKPDSEIAKKKHYYYQTMLSLNGEPLTIDATPYPKKDTPEETPAVTYSQNSYDTVSQSDIELTLIEKYVSDEMEDLNEAMYILQKDDRCQALEDAKSIAGNIEKYLKNKIRDRDYGNLDLSTSAYNRVVSMLQAFSESVSPLNRTPCRN